VRGKSSRVFAPSVWRGPTDRPAIALTFDDGPSESTPALLRVLASTGTAATFFQCGQNIRRLPAIAREVRDAQHEIGNHSDTHPYFSFRSPAFIHSEFHRAQQTIEDTLQLTPEFLRAPFGVRWPGFRSLQAQLGLTGVMWSVIGRDWKLPDNRIAARVLSRVGNGAIICLHDGRALTPNPDIRQTTQAVERLVPELQARGYRFVTISQLLCPIN
jgi:peptidoglycan/xylan/chitin deacetylase (PgdA/CDA1 family)